MIGVVLSFILGVGAGSSIHAQQALAWPAPSQPLTDRLKQLRGLENELKKQESDNAQDPKRRLFLAISMLQSIAHAKSFVGDTVGATVAKDTHQKNREIAYGKSKESLLAGDLLDLNTAVAEDAIPAIVAASKDRQIVILNEAHTAPVHRAFAMRVARELRKIGFEYLACETFAEDDMQPMANGYVTQQTGYFSNEPTYANFLNDAFAAKWKFVSYEGGATSEAHSLQPTREATMAKNIVERIFKKNPKAKVFVFVGHSHVLALPASRTDNDESKFAAQLKRLTGIAPLTIDQEHMFEHYKSEVQTGIYREALTKIGNTPSVLRTPEGRFLKLAMNPNAVDIQVIHPAYRISQKTQRAEWLTSLAGLNPSSIPTELLPQRGKRLIYAYRLLDPLDAIPVDVIMVEAGKPAPKLMLPPGDFRYAVED